MKKLAIMAGALGLLVTTAAQADGRPSSWSSDHIAQQAAGTGTLPSSTGTGPSGGTLPPPTSSMVQGMSVSDNQGIGGQSVGPESVGIESTGVTEVYSLDTDTAIMQIFYDQLSPSAKQTWSQLPPQWREAAVELAQEDLNNGSFYNIDDPDQYVDEALDQYQSTLIEPEQ